MDRYYTITLSEEDRNKIKEVNHILDFIVEEVSEFPDDRIIITNEDCSFKDEMNVSIIKQTFDCLLSLENHECLHVTLNNNEFIKVDETFVS